MIYACLVSCLMQASTKNGSTPTTDRYIGLRYNRPANVRSCLNSSTINPLIKLNVQPHVITHKISPANQPINHPAQNNTFLTKSDYITQPHPSIPPNQPRNWSNQTPTPSDKLVGPCSSSDDKMPFFIVLILVHSLLSFAPK